MLLGLLREDWALTHRYLQSYGSGEAIRKQIEGHSTIREQVPTSVDLPLTNECKRVLAYAAKESERLAHKCIGTGHLLLGLLREDQCFAAKILHERGQRLDAIPEDLSHTDGATIGEPSRSTGALLTVAISSLPTGAEIEVDNAFLGHTPAEVPLAAGERLITLTKQGYKPWRRMLRVVSGGKQTIPPSVISSPGNREPPPESPKPCMQQKLLVEVGRRSETSLKPISVSCSRPSSSASVR